MGKPFKIILAITAGLILLIAVVVFTLPFIINPNDFKPQIAAAVKDRIGRELTLEGELTLSVFPWLGVSTGKMALSNAPGFQNRPFAQIESGNVKVKLLPLLLTNKIEVSRIVLKGLSLNLEKNPQGVSNWADLIKTKESHPTTTAEDNKAIAAKSPASALTVLGIGGIDLENAHVTWDDQAGDKHFEMQDLNLKTEKLAYNEPFAIELALVLLNTETKLTEAIQFNSEVTLNEQLDQFLFSKINLQTTITGENIPGKSLSGTLTTDVALDLAKETIKISDLRLNSGGINIVADITGNSLKDKPVFQGPVSVAAFSPAQFMKQMDIALPAMQDAKALNMLAINFNLQATENSANLQDLVLKLDDTQAKGTLGVHDFSQPQPAITFNLVIDALDVDRYLPPAKAEKKSKPLASPAIAAAAATSLIPVESLRKLNANGQITLDSLTVSGLSMQGIQLKLDAKNGIMTTQQSVSQFYRGAYSGNAILDVRHQQPKIEVNEKLSQVQLEPLLKDYKGEARMSGAINATAQLQSQGKQTDELISALNGQISFLFKDGVIKGFNLQKIIDQGKSLIEGTPVPTDSKTDQTVFSEMSGTATISQGVLKNEDLKAKASKMHAEGKGTANLNTEALDYQINARILKDKSSEKIEGIPVAVNIGGTFSKPTYTLDIKSMITDENKAKIEEKKQKLLKKLDKKLGPGASDLLKRLF